MTIKEQYQQNGWDYDEYENRSIIPGEKNLYTWCREHGDAGKKIMNEWDSAINEYDMPDILEYHTYGESRKKYRWKCEECGNIFYMTIVSRTSQGQSCPKCGIKKQGKKIHDVKMKKGNDLLSWCMNNGAWGKILIDEWDEEENLKEFGRNMSDVSSKDGNSYNWICSKCGEKFKAKTYRRTGSRASCTKCGKYGTSFPEQFIYYSLKQVFPNAIHRGKEFGKIEFDISIPEKKVYIEYNGEYWHREKKGKDEEKKNICQQKGVRLFNIYAYNRGTEWETEGDDIKYRIYDKKHISQLNKIVRFILESIGEQSKIELIDFTKAEETAISKMYNDVENNLADQYPMLTEEWDSELNGILKPSNFPTGSHKVIKWKCKKCHRGWSVSINSRIKFKSGCPNCGYNIFDGIIHTHAIKKSRAPFFG